MCANLVIGLLYMFPKAQCMSTAICHYLHFLPSIFSFYGLLLLIADEVNTVSFDAVKLTNDCFLWTPNIIDVLDFLHWIHRHILQLTFSHLYQHLCFQIVFIAGLLLHAAYLPTLHLSVYNVSSPFALEPSNSNLEI